MAETISFFHGKEEDIQAQVDAGVIDTSDFIVTSDTDALVYIDADKTQHELGSSKTKELHTVQLGENGELGGLKTGDNIAAKTTIDELVSKILTKRILPTYLSPFVTLEAVDAKPGVYEVGSEITSTFTADFHQNDAGNIKSIAINDGSVDFLEGTASPLKASSHAFTLGEEPMVFQASVTYADGPIKTDNLGEESAEGQILGDTITSNTVTFTGKRCAFYGSGAGEIPELTSKVIRGLGNSALAPTEGDEFEISVAVGDKYAVFACPTTAPDVNQITYVQTGDINILPKFTQSVVSVEGANGFAAVDYKVYFYEMAVAAVAPMTFKINI